MSAISSVLDYSCAMQPPTPLPESQCGDPAVLLKCATLQFSSSPDMRRPFILSLLLDCISRAPFLLSKTV